jgi:hypothetical protein
MMSDNSNRGGDYEVGYRKTPKHTRFALGHSGHFRRRLKPKDLRTVLLNALNERVNITENGERRRITKLEAITKQLVNRAAAGEVRAVKFLSERLRDSDDAGAPSITFKLIDDDV